MTWSRALGHAKHEVALDCAARALERVWPDFFKIEQRMRYRPESKSWEPMSREEESALIKAGRTSELRGTLVPDIILYLSRDARWIRAYIMDFKFPCPPEKDPVWGQERNAPGAPIATQSDRYRQLLEPPFNSMKPKMISPKGIY